MTLLSSGVVCCLSVGFTSAPASINTSTTFSWPLEAAQSRGVHNTAFLEGTNWHFVPSNNYSRTSLIWTPVIRALPSTAWAADFLYLSEIVDSTVGVAYYNLLYSEMRTNLSCRHPLIPRRPDMRGFTIVQLNGMHSLGL